MARWIVINCYPAVDRWNRMPDEYLLEKGFKKKEIDALFCTDEEKYWENKYLREKQEGIVIYVTDGGYTSPQIYKKDVLVSCNSNHLNSFKNYTPDRYLVWKDFRTQVKYTLERFIREFMFSINNTHRDNDWRVVDFTMEEVCRECSVIVNKGSLKINFGGKWVCETCILKKAKNSATNGGYIYFIKESQTGLVKIGKSTDVERRIQILQTGVPFDVEVAFKFYSDNYSLTETIFHKFFVSKKVRGEWYRLSEKDIEWVKSNYISLTKTVKVNS